MNDETQISRGPYNRIGIGTVLNELYIIDSVIGVGGMGEVYRGHAIETGEQVAIKTIRAEHAQNVDALTLFKKEARALRKVYHDAIVRYFVFTVDKPLGLPYLAMEFVEGESLSDILQRGKLSFEELCILVRRVASGLHAAHVHGIIHRDVSPDNVIVPEGDLAKAKIIDFGIARSAMGEATVIGSGFAGKFNYVSPEQLGLYEGDVTAQSDVYSLGLVIAEASIGHPLDMGRSHVEVIEKRRRLPDLSEVDPRIRPLLQSMLQPNPKDRPADMAAVAAWVPAVVRSSGGRAGRLAVSGLAATALLGLVGTGAWLYGPGMLAWWDRPVVKEEQPAPPKLPDPRPTPPTPPVEQPTPPAPPPVEPPPKTDPAPPPRTPATIEQIAAFVRSFQGGPCFFVSPVSLSQREAVIEAFGSSPAPFLAFDSEFQQQLGFEPEIHLRQITAAQCPVIDMMIRQAGQRIPRLPVLNLKSDRLRNGEELTGTIDYRPDAALEVLLVGDNGLAYNLSTYLKRAGERSTFGLRLEGQATPGEPKPQLVVVVASPRPLASLKGASSVQAAQLFRQVAEEATRTGQQVTVAVRYFKLGT